jgi:hypothetical protein
LLDVINSITRLDIESDGLALQRERTKTRTNSRERR